MIKHIFLNSSRKDNLNLDQKLFSILEVNAQNQITRAKFVKGYLQFKADLNLIGNIPKNKIILIILKKIVGYKSEKLSPELLCENANITME